jgi:hypothetical protein
MVWADICHDGRTQLKIVQGTLNAVKYRHDIIDPIGLLFLSWTDRNCHAVWRFAEFSHVCDHLLQQRQLRISDA